MLSNKALSASKSVEPVYIEEVFSTYLYTGTAANQTIINGIQLGNSYSPGTAGGSGLFNGTNNYLSVPTGTALNLTGDFTIECWVYQTGAGVLPSIIGNGAYPTTSQIALIISGSTPVFYLSSGSGWVVAMASSIPVSLNTWTHLAVSCSGSTFGIWVNGIYAGTATYSGARATPSATTLIGRLYTDTDDYYFPGYISNFRLVNGIAIYTGTSNFTVPSSALTAVSGTALLCLQGGSPFVDNSANALTITNNNSTTASGLGPFPFTLVPGKGGLVWQKGRSSVSANTFIDTVRGGGNYITSNTDNGQISTTALIFNNNGFTTQGTWQNTNAATYVGWTFRKQPKFFDVVTYTGTGSATTIAHNLGSVPGMIIIKNISSAGVDWVVYHRSIGNTKGLYLNSTSAEVTNSSFWNDTTPTSTVFSIGGFNTRTNLTGDNYVAYLFAHDAGGFGLSGNDNVISCGSYTGTGATQSISLGYEPQYVLLKTSSASGWDWYQFDIMRGMSNTSNAYLSPNKSVAETVSSSSQVVPTATGFNITGSTAFNLSGETYIYMAIRRGPMATPTSGTSVFAPYVTNTVAASASGSTSTSSLYRSDFVTDFVIQTRKAFADSKYAVSRLTGNQFLTTNTTDAESTSTVPWDSNIAALNFSSNYGQWMFRRAPGFLDVVCYTGTGTSTRAINHNLGVAPELIIIKNRSQTGGSTADTNWVVNAPSLLSSGNVLFLNTTGAQFNWSGIIGGTVSSTSSTFLLTDNPELNRSSQTYVAYLFASVPGVSKVGSYTGNGSTQTINAGLPTGARFVMIKRTDSTSDWRVWDSARGMVSGTSNGIPYNTTAAETNSNDIYTTTNGFQLATGDGSINANGGTYIYLAIA